MFKMLDSVIFILTHVVICTGVVGFGDQFFVTILGRLIILNWHILGWDSIPERLQWCPGRCEVNLTRVCSLKYNWEPTVVAIRNTEVWYADLYLSYKVIVDRVFFMNSYKEIVA